MAAMRILAAVRQRLVNDPTIASFVGDRIFPRQIHDEFQPQFPCITIWLQSGNQGVWAPKVYDPGIVMCQIFSKHDLQQCLDIYDQVSLLLHNQQQFVSFSDFCCKQIRETWSNSGVFDDSANYWYVSARYLIHGFVLT